MSGEGEFLKGKFPDGFMWSSATASYQIEGGWNEDGKGVSIWDTFSHNPDNIKDKQTGDIACDTYHKYEEDIKLIKDLGTKYYRLSLAWTRIHPDGTKASFNQAGVDFYNKFIDGLKAAGIEPVVTLYHWDLPQALQDQGGWKNEELVGHFCDYARTCFEAFGDRVKWWITFNEPSVFVWNGHGAGTHAPGIKDPFDTIFKVAHTFHKAHAKAYHIFDKEIRPKHGGKCGVTLNADWSEPKDCNNPKDQACSELMNEIKLGWYANPVFGDGDYPAVFKKVCGDLAAMLGAPQSPLPEFTEEEKKLNKGSSDFFGLNHYTTRYVSPCEQVAALPEDPDNVGTLVGVMEDRDPNWVQAGSSWLYVVPWGLRKLVKWISDHYGNPPIFVTENGVSDNTGELNDTARIDYIKGYTNELLKAIKLDNCNVIGYTLWSLMDNFEWAEGYTERFGIHHVDYNDPERKRTPKESARFFAKLIKDNGFE